MPAVDPKSLPVNLRRNSPARRMTPQEMRTAVAELKNKAPAPSTKPPSSIGPVNPIGPRGDSPPPIMLPPTGPTKPGYEPPPTGPMPAPIPNTPYIGENTGKKTATVGDEVYKAPAPVAPQQPKPPQMESLPGPGGEKFPISRSPSEARPDEPMLIRRPPPSDPVAYAQQRALRDKQMQDVMNVIGMTYPAPTPTPPRTPQQMMRKGGQVKTQAYASGGTVRGSGIAQRGVKKCKIY